MSTPVAVSGPSRPVIEVDARRLVPDARAGMLARRAAARYGAYGTALLEDVQEHGAATRAGRPDADDTWTLVGRWLTLVAVLSVLACAVALCGNHTSL